MRILRPRRRRMYEKRKEQTHLDNLEEVVRSAYSFKNIGVELKWADYEYEYLAFTTYFNEEYMPSYYVSVDGFKFIITNKRYEKNADRVVGEIAIKLL